MHTLQVRAAQFVRTILQTLVGTPTRDVPPLPRAGYVGCWASGSGFVEMLAADRYRISEPTTLPTAGEDLRLVLQGHASSPVVHRVRVRRVRSAYFEADRLHRDPAAPSEEPRLGDD